MTIALTLPTMRQILDRWMTINNELGDAEAEWRKGMGADIGAEATRARRAITERMAEQAEPHLPAFLQIDHSCSAEELEEIASRLSPGGAHTGGLLVNLVRANRWDADPLMIAAVLRYNWHGGKRGFQFLPDPADTDLDQYQDEVEDLMDVLEQGTNGDPRRTLTGDDLAFFDSLPDRFSVYRGCAGISAERAELGVCWTLNREVAEWFARRGSGEPIVLMAGVKKADVRLAKADEFEVVCTPRRARQIKVRSRAEKWRPAMSWAALQVPGDTIGERTS